MIIGSVKTLSLQKYNTETIVLVYVIGWGAVVFGINCASNAGKKL